MDGFCSNLDHLKAFAKILQQDHCALRLHDLAAFFIDQKCSRNAPHLTKGIASGRDFSLNGAPDEGPRRGGVQRAALQGAQGAAAPAVQHARHLQRRRPPLDRLGVRPALEVHGPRAARLPSRSEAEGTMDE